MAPSASRGDRCGVTRARWLDGLLADEGLHAESDAAGNNWITLPGARPETVIIGGHLDSVPNGGWLDGALGVLAGIEALRRFRGTTPPVTLAVVDFADEEGARFSRSLLGSSGASGSLVPDSVRGLVDRQGVRLVDALAENGVDLDRMPEARRSLDRRHPRAYLELHIEQGPVLESMGRSDRRGDRHLRRRAARAAVRRPGGALGVDADRDAPRRVPGRRRDRARLSRDRPAPLDARRRAWCARSAPSRSSRRS